MNFSRLLFLRKLIDVTKMRVRIMKLPVLLMVKFSSVLFYLCHIFEWQLLFCSYPVNIFKVNNINSWKGCLIYLKVNNEGTRSTLETVPLTLALNIFHTFFLVFLFLTLNSYLFGRSFALLFSIMLTLIY